jgi:pullulanase
MTRIEEIYNHCLQQPVHNHAVLHEYDLMERNEKRTIRYIMLNDFGEAEIFPATDHLPSFLSLYEWDYNSMPDKTGHFAGRQLFNIPVVRCSGRYFLQHFALNPNFSMFVRTGHEDVSIYHNSNHGSALTGYFDASEGSSPGCFLQGETVTFSMWSPPAGRVQVLLFGKDQQLIKTGCSMDLKRGDKGMWTGRFSLQDIPEAECFEGLYYQYLVYAYGRVRMACDPWSWSLAPANTDSPDKIGKAAIVDRKKINSAERFTTNSKLLSDPVEFTGYEAHIRDFTAGNEFNDEERGTYLAFKKNLPHISSMGFSHIQLMPVMKFYTVNENNRTQYGVHNGFANYNWGYDAHHYFSPEGWYSTNPHDPYNRIFELQSLTDEIHRHGLGVIFDVVYNHTYLAETLENISPGWYYRQNSDGKISGHTGAGAGLESRQPMTRKLIIDSLKHYIIYYGADGFRFDLLGFMDHETLQLIRNEAGSCYNPDDPGELLLHGEGWEFTDLPVMNACTKLNMPSPEIQVALFNDCMRDGLMGHHTGTGMLQGNTAVSHMLASAITGACRGYNPGITPFNHAGFHDPYCMFASEPQQTLNFISIHDGFTLWDKINLTVNTGHNEKLQLLCQAATVLFTSQGKLMWHGGEEFMRSKPAGECDREPWRVHSSDFAAPFNNVKHFHENSFGASDFTNMIRTDRDESNLLKEYLKGLSEIRRKTGMVLGSAEEIKRKLRFIPAYGKDTQNGMYRFESFSDPRLPSLTLSFINGPADTVCYICGEIHPHGTDGNPAENPIAVRFDMYGNGFLTLTKEQINAFDSGKWGSAYGIKIKLVFRPGQWDYIGSAYSPGGNNLLMPSAITENHEITIDLSQQDCVCPPPLPPSLSMAYTIETNPEQTGYKTILVAHNFSDEKLRLENVFPEKTTFVLLADSSRADIKGIKDSRVVHYSSDGIVTTEAHTSLIAAIP